MGKYTVFHGFPTLTAVRFDDLIRDFQGEVCTEDSSWEDPNLNR